jgi:hypothetical protein
VVADDQPNRELLVRLLSHHGHRGESVGNTDAGRLLTPRATIASKWPRPRLRRVSRDQMAAGDTVDSRPGDRSACCTVLIILKMSLR